MKKQSIYFLVIIILLVQTSCQQNNEEEDFFNNQITLLENNPRLYLSKIDSTQVTNLNNSKEATHFLLVSLANYYVNNYYPPKEVLQKSIHIFTKKKLIQQQLESLLFLAKTYKKEKNLKMEVQAIEKAIDIASQIEDKEWLCCLYGYLGDMYIRKYNMLKFIKYQTLANQCIEDIAFRDMDISTQVQTAKSFLYIGNHKKSYELLNLIESSIDKNNIYYNEIKCEAKMFILRDFEIAKQIAMLRYTQKEQSAKFIKELNRFNITQNNSLLTTQWDNFYKHIDLSFDNFYTLLKDNFSDLNEKELQLCCMMVAGFKTEEIAAIWMQSIFSVHKYKTNIRKKLKTPEGANIIAFLRSAPPFQ